ncbi:sucrose-6-phosphate hydrolase SacC (GH32 family) [Arthrobacter sp. SLBN-112]|nr:sucrose-6-phosphate hydrolase SacC (GH32 family) [Arthrobacter sp. SLBN-112]
MENRRRVHLDEVPRQPGPGPSVRNFRDPKVFRYSGPAGSCWVMVAVEAREHKVVLDRSDDLKTWEDLSSFGPANGTRSVWECPDRFPLPLDGNEDNIKRVLTVNLNPGDPNGGSAGQYFVGHFDGVRFSSATTVTEGLQDPARLSEYLWLDWGRDFYAAVSFNNVPDGRRLMLGWMNNWQYGNDIPTSPWRSPMSLAREVSPITSNGQLRLSQRAVCEADTAPEHGVTYTGLNLEAGLHAMAGGTAAQLIEATFIPGQREDHMICAFLWTNPQWRSSRKTDRSP